VGPHIQQYPAGKESGKAPEESAEVKLSRQVKNKNLRHPQEAKANVVAPEGREVVEVVPVGATHEVRIVEPTPAPDHPVVLPPVNGEPTLHRKVNPINRKIILADCFWKMDPPPSVLLS
jgi:hypothetical protein